MEDEWELTSHFRQKGKNVQNRMWKKECGSLKEMTSLGSWREEGYVWSRGPGI